MDISKYRVHSKHTGEAGAIFFTTVFMSVIVGVRCMMSNIDRMVCTQILNSLYLIECFVQRIGAESSLILVDLAQSYQTARLAQTSLGQ